MAPPSVSVILPTHNRAGLLRRAIDSVFDQSFRDLELIVVDDCSSDSTPQELMKIEDPRLRVIRLQTNSGPAAARNAGIRAAVGKFIAFQDSDTKWLPAKLAKQMDLLQSDIHGQQRPAACSSRFILAVRGKQIVRPSDPASQLSGHIYCRLLYGNTMDTPATVIRRDVLDSIGLFDEHLVNLEDWDLGLRIAADHPMAFLDEVTHIALDSPRSVNKRLSPESEAAIFEKHLASYQACPDAMARITWSIGVAYAKRNQRQEAMRYMNLSLDRQPTGSKRIAFAAVRLGLNPYPILHFARTTLRP